MAVSTAIDASVVARVLGIKTEYRNLAGGQAFLLPQRVALLGQGNTASSFSTTKKRVYSAGEVGSTYGYGSPLRLAAKQLLPENGDGLGSISLTVYPMGDAVAGAAAATGDITPSISSIVPTTARVKINNIYSAAFTIETGDDVAALTAKVTTAINAITDVPVIAADGTTTIDLTSKWKGTSANDIYVEIEEVLASGVTWAISQLSGGATNPTVDDSLDQIGNVWETMILNCFEFDDTTALATFSTFGDGRWGATVRKPLVVFTGNIETAVADAYAVSDSRKSDKTNAYLVSPASHDLPCVVAARQLARIAKTANNNPPMDYGSQKADGLTPGADGSQWNLTQRDAAVKAGCSTIEVKDEVVNISDVVTFYHPTGEATPRYRYVCDIVKLQNIIYNLNLIFATDEWDGAPLLPDDQPTTNPTAKKPKNAKAEIAALMDSLGLEAIISDPEFAKESILAVISSTNPKRLDAQVTVKLSGNTNIISVDLFFGFYFGEAQTV